MLNLSVRIHSLNGKVYFEIVNEVARGFARSIDYHAICDLESALRSLNRLACVNTLSIGSQASGFVAVTSEIGRHRIRLTTTLSKAEIVTMIRALPSAAIVDARDVRRIRSRLTGQVSDFT